MTIDEKIIKLRKAAKEKYSEAFLRQANLNDGELDNMIECARDCRQLAAWLEDYKAIRQWKSDVVDGFCKYDANSIEELVRNARKKAIDDFVENFLIEISESIIWGMLANCVSIDETSDKIVDYIADTIKKTAEQLNGGKEDE